MNTTNIIDLPGLDFATPPKLNWVVGRNDKGPDAVVLLAKVNVEATEDVVDDVPENIEYGYSVRYWQEKCWKKCCLYFHSLQNWDLNQLTNSHKHNSTQNLPKDENEVVPPLALLADPKLNVGALELRVVVDGAPNLNIGAVVVSAFFSTVFSDVLSEITIL